MWITGIFAAFRPAYPARGFPRPKFARAGGFLRLRGLGTGESMTRPGTVTGPGQPASRLAIIQLAGTEARKPTTAATTIGTVVS